MLNTRLKSYRQEKLKRKLSVDTQLLNAAQEDLEIKKRLIEKIDNMDKQQANHMNRLTSNMEQLTGSIVEGFAMLRQVMLTPCGMPPQFTTPQTGHQDMYNRMPHRQPMNAENNTNNTHFQYNQSLFPNNSF